MKKVLFVALAFLLIAINVATARTVVITADRGGTVVDYIIKLKKYEKENVAIKIAGKCASACTIYLAHDNVCVTKNARLMFHAPYGADREGNEMIKGYLWRKYPKWAQNYINARGGLTSKEIWIDYKVLKDNIKTCV